MSVQASPLDSDVVLQKTILDKIREVNQKGKSNRMAEVQNARDQRLYFRSIQEFTWSEDLQDVMFEDDADSPYSRVFNVYQGYGKIFVSTFLGARGKSRAEADDPFDESSIRATQKAQVWERVYEKYNKPQRQQLNLGMLMWTDGRIVSLTEDRDEKTITRFFGVLESRLPTTARPDEDLPLKNCNLIELEWEESLAQMKAAYPDARGKINSGNGDGYERNARLSVMRLAGSDTAIDTLTGEDSYGLGTKTISFLRPAFYEEFKEADRAQLQEMFPLGLSITHTGDVYLESAEYDVDAHLDVLHAMPGDGMSRPSIGATMMPIQDSVNTVMNLTEEMFDHGIPTTYYDSATNVDGLNKQRELPGASRKMTRKAGEAAKDHFFETTPVNPPQQLFEYGDLMRGPYAQFASGQQPALFGGDMDDQKTAHGYAQAKQMALGQMAIVWIPYTDWLSREKTRAVRLDSTRTDEISALLDPERPGGKPQAVRILPGELKGASFTNISDENFPETFTEKSNKLMNVLQMGGPLSLDLLKKCPNNLYYLKEMLGMEELVIPGEDLTENVLADIASMEKMPPQPDPNALPQQAIPQPGQPPAQPQLVSPIQIDTEFLDPDDYEVGYGVVKHWIQTTGQEIKASNPIWFQNVRLYGLQYKQGMIQAAQAAAPKPEPPRVSLTAQVTDPNAVSQLLALEGVQSSPGDIAASKLPETQNALADAQQKSATAQHKNVLAAKEAITPIQTPGTPARS